MTGHMTSDALPFCIPVSLLSVKQNCVELLSLRSKMVNADNKVPPNKRGKLIALHCCVSI